MPSDLSIITKEKRFTKWPYYLQDLTLEKGSYTEQNKHQRKITEHYAYCEDKKICTSHAGFRHVRRFITALNCNGI